MRTQLRIIVSGLIAQHAQLGGVAWDYVQYVAGLAGLGHDVYYFEDTGDWPYRLGAGGSDEAYPVLDCRENAARLAAVMARFGLGERWAYRCGIDGAWFGLTDSRRGEVIDTADLVLNISGTLEHPEAYGRRAKLVYIDSDPGFTQIVVAGDRAPFAARIAGHDVHFSFGETVNRFVEGGRYDWRPTRQPILLDEWRSDRPPGSTFTTVMSWAAYTGTTFQGRRYGEKGAEFQRFVELPARVAPTAMEVALPQPHLRPRWDAGLPGLPSGAAAYLQAEPDCTLDGFLRHFGWHVVEATARCGDLDAYRSYILSSMAEWSVAKQGYVVSRSGWFSCRSACYLAAGRPVVVQDTGFSEILPTGEGLLTFSTIEEAEAAVVEVRAHHRRHGAAARAVADAYFDARRVLARLIDEAGSTSSAGAPRDLDPRPPARAPGPD